MASTYNNVCAHNTSKVQACLEDKATSLNLDDAFKAPQTRENMLAHANNLLGDTIAHIKDGHSKRSLKAYVTIKSISLFQGVLQCCKFVFCT